MVFILWRVLVKNKNPPINTGERGRLYNCFSLITACTGLRVRTVSGFAPWGCSFVVRIL